MSQLIPPTEEQLAGVNLGMMFYSGTFPLEVGQTERFSMALLFGNDENDLVRNKRTVQNIYNANYNFAQPPEQPTLTYNIGVGDGRVVLYWDDFAEYSYDRFLQEYDFEGYRLYRSTDPSFIDSWIITDAYGNPTYRRPLEQWDLDDGRFGPHPVTVYGASFDMGEDTGLRHSYVDEDVTNGVTYYYAIVSYDYGKIEGEEIVDTLITSEGEDSVVVRFLPLLDESGNILGIAPTECPSSIIGDVGGDVSLPINAVAVTPNAPAAGYVPPRLEGGLQHLSGGATGDIEISILEPDSLQDGHVYNVVFEEADTYGPFLHFTKSFSLIDSTTGEVLYTSPEGAFGLFRPWQEGDPQLWIDDPLLRRNRAFTLDPEADTLHFWHQSTAIFEPPMIDGFSIWPQNDRIDYSGNIVPDLDTVYWTASSGGNYEGDLRYFILNNGSNISLDLPFSYEIRFHGDLTIEDSLHEISGSYVDSSLAVLGTFRKRYVNFEVWNTTLDERSDFVVLANRDSIPDANGDPQDVLVDFWILPYISFRDTLASRDMHIMGVGFYSLINPQAIDTTITPTDTTIVRTDFPAIPPGDGDMIGYRSHVPFSENDVYSFTVRQGSLERDRARRELDRIAVVPNPYVATAEWEPRIEFITGRGPRKIDFIHLPQQCTIRIYTLSGFLVDTIEHSSPADNGAASWNLVSKDGMDVAYGIYLYHVDAPGVGEYIGKFAVIK